MSATFDPASDLLESLSDRFTERELADLRRALVVAEQAHHGQTRGTGEPYVCHPIAVAKIVASWKLDLPTITAAVLHDVPEDTSVSLESLREQFGAEIAELVEAVTKLSRVRLPEDSQDIEAENLRRLLLAMARDLRVVLLKLADRLHNMRTLKGVAAAKRRRIATETLEVFAPLADRLGMGEVRSELDDLGFRYADPAEYRWTQRQLEHSQHQRTRYIAQVKRQFADVLAAEGISAVINARTKNLYSLYRKLLDKERDINQIYDLFAVRIIVDTVEQCYQGMGVIHHHWQPLPHRIKDYIAVPKSNGYRSLHTTIFGPGKRLLEVQLRTHGMHREAELGVAAHTIYAEHKRSVRADDEQIALMRQLQSWQDELGESPEFISRFKLDLFGNRLFAFTPKGALFSLPHGATPVDFAYTVHSEIGNTCSGAKVNGVIVPLDAPLQNGDVVEILTKQNSLPKRDWLEFVRTGHARSQIRSHFRKLARTETILAGREMLSRALKNHHRAIASLTDHETELIISKARGANSFDDVLQQLGEGRLGIGQVLRAVGLEQAAPRIKPKATQPLGVSVSGVGSLLVKRSKCCQPQPPQQIIGYITVGKGLSIHRRRCPQVANLPDPSRIIAVQWAESGPR